MIKNILKLAAIAGFVGFSQSGHSQDVSELEAILTSKVQAIESGSYKWKVTRFMEGDPAAGKRAVEQHRADSSIKDADKDLEAVYNFYAKPREETFEFDLDILDATKWKTVQHDPQNPSNTITHYYSGDGRLYRSYDKVRNIMIRDATPFDAYSMLPAIPELYLKGILSGLDKLVVKREGEELKLMHLSSQGDPDLVAVIDAKTFDVKEIATLQDGIARERISKNERTVVYEAVSKTADGGKRIDIRTEWELLDFKKPKSLDVAFKLDPGYAVSIDTATTKIQNIPSDDILMKKQDYAIPSQSK